jgi:micrococcal nuclease
MHRDTIHRAVTWGTLLAALILTYLIASQDTTHPVISGYPYIHDGDTIRIGKYHIRLWGIDAEELDEPHGIEAQRALARVIGTSKVSCTLYEMSYKRHVGRCFIVRACGEWCATHTDIGEEMIRSGYALDCRAYSGGKYRQLEPAGVRVKLLQKAYCTDKSYEGEPTQVPYRHARAY